MRWCDLVFRGAARHGAVSGQSEQRSLAASFPLEAPRGIQHGGNSHGEKKKKSPKDTAWRREEESTCKNDREREKDRNRESMRERENAINLKHDAGARTTDACWVSLQA